jgi:hypothetical protein
MLGLRAEKGSQKPNQTLFADCQASQTIVSGRWEG